MWDCLRQVYYQDNFARKFQLELDIGNYRQGNLSIEQFYSGLLNLWSEYSRLVQSKLQPELKNARIGLINRNLAWKNFRVKNNVSPHNLTLINILLVLRWLTWFTLLRYRTIQISIMLPLQGVGTHCKTMYQEILQLLQKGRANY